MYAFFAGNVRLVDGPSPQMGRVEVYRNNFWGTVCGVGFKRENAFVICTSLGYS